MCPLWTAQFQACSRGCWRPLLPLWECHSLTQAVVTVCLSEAANNSQGTGQGVEILPHSMLKLLSDAPACRS